MWKQIQTHTHVVKPTSPVDGLFLSGQDARCVEQCHAPQDRALGRGSLEPEGKFVEVLVRTHLARKGPPNSWRWVYGFFLSTASTLPGTFSGVRTRNRSNIRAIRRNMRRGRGAFPLGAEAGACPPAPCCPPPRTRSRGKCQWSALGQSAYRGNPSRGYI